MAKSTEITEYKPRLPYHPALKEKIGIGPGEWNVLVDTVFPSAKTAGAVALAVSYCKARKLDIFKRVVHIVPIWDKERGCMVETVWPGIAEHRTTASRTREYAGHDECVFGPDVQQTFADGDRDITVTFPAWAQMTVYRLVQGQRCPFPGPKVRWLETYASKKNDAPNSMWADRPYGMIEKCFDEETEVLTDRGFEPFSAVTGRILEVTESGLEPTAAEPFQQDWNGPMVAVTGEAMNFMVTPNHDMLTNFGKIEAGELFKKASSRPKYRIPLSVTGTKNDLGISDADIILSAAVLCDGYANGAFWSVGVSKRYKIECLEEVGRHHSRQTRAMAGAVAQTSTRTITTTLDREVFDYAMYKVPLVMRDKQPNFSLILRLSRYQARLFADMLVYFDGSVTPTGTRRFYSSDAGRLAGFEIAAVAGGYSVSPRSERTSDISEKPNFYVTISDKESLPVVGSSASGDNMNALRVRGSVRTIRQTNAVPRQVWCVTVPSGVIVVRRHGLSMLCGNCAEAAALRSAFPEELGDEPSEVEASGRNWHGRPAVDVNPITTATISRADAVVHQQTPREIEHQIQNEPGTPPDPTDDEGSSLPIPQDETQSTDTSEAAEKPLTDRQKKYRAEKARTEAAGEGQEEDKPQQPDVTDEEILDGWKFRMEAVETLAEVIKIRKGVLPQVPVRLKTRVRNIIVSKQNELDVP